MMRLYVGVSQQSVKVPLPPKSAATIGVVRANSSVGECPECEINCSIRRLCIHSRMISNLHMSELASRCGSLKQGIRNSNFQAFSVACLSRGTGDESMYETACATTNASSGSRTSSIRSSTLPFCLSREAHTSRDGLSLECFLLRARHPSLSNQRAASSTGVTRHRRLPYEYIDSFKCNYDLTGSDTAIHVFVTFLRFADAGNTTTSFGRQTGASRRAAPRRPVLWPLQHGRQVFRGALYEKQHAAAGTSGGGLGQENSWVQELPSPVDSFANQRMLAVASVWTRCSGHWEQGLSVRWLRRGAGESPTLFLLWSSIRRAGCVLCFYDRC